MGMPRMVREMWNRSSILSRKRPGQAFGGRILQWREDFAIASEGFEESGLCISVGDKVEVVQATKGAIEGVGVGVELFL